MQSSDFFTPEDQRKIVEAIKTAEKQTSGEVKVHIEKLCPEPDPFDRAKYVFEFLALHKTSNRNGVLFYLAYEDRKFAILGDKGIYEKLGQGFWDDTATMCKSYFAEGNYLTGLTYGIEKAGEKLRDHFPYHKNDINELSDDLSFG
ncbi:MAG: TPM domain-containing protein [Leadbetterella sp.]